MFPARVILILVAFGVVASRAEDFELFERKVRPVLAENCFECHGAEKQKGGLRLDSPAGIRAGGESGPILVAGKPNESRMVRAIGYKDKELQMPPKKRLTERQVADVTEWIARGAAMPASDAVVAKSGFEITEKDREHWAFKAVKRPAAPKGENAVDGFVRAELKKRGLAMNAGATKRELIRRAYFDLIGLPPTPEEVAAFEKDNSTRAYERVIDDLLARPEYGERWARHWLDLARFAQSDGYERDGEKPLAWRYRDYVVRAFNNDKPYDRFVKEQIAGDELPDADADSVAATGFQRLGVYDDEPDDKTMAEYDALDDVLVTTGTAFLGLTIGCARCHDHKFDPISQADYYSMLSFFRNVRHYDGPLKDARSAGFAPLAAPAAFKDWLKKNPTNAPANSPFEWTLAVREGKTNAVTKILKRGNPATPGAPVEPAFLKVIARDKLPTIRAPEHGMSSGRRLALAEWIASAENPLTARVMVNRVWQHHFGRGLVKTTSDFGKAGSAPTHPQLLDWLAAEFVDSGWSIKRLHKTIMLSDAYQQSSRAQNEAATKIDPANEFLWRQNLRRLEAESVRDTVLSIAGTLNPKMGGRGFFPHLSGEVLAGQSRPGLDWQVSSEAEKSRRSLYAFVRRTMPIPILESLDYSNTTSPLSERATTTVAPQALILVNDEFMHAQADAFATRLEREGGSDELKQIRRAYALAMNREPTNDEVKIARAWLERQRKALAGMREEITFHPDVANALSTDYFALLEPSQFLAGPDAGWNYFRGFWAPPYEGIRVVDKDRSPFALLNGLEFETGEIEFNLQLSPSTEAAGIFLRAKAEGDLARGYEIVFDPRAQKISLRKHDRDLKTVVEAPAKFGSKLRLRIEVKDGRLFASIDGRQAIDASVEPAGKQIGVRAWGGALTMDRFLPAEADCTAHRALQSFALLVLNLNEVIYVD